jgi:hypothetical protein
MTGQRFSGWFGVLLIVLCASAPASAAQWEPLPLWGGAVQVAAAQGDSSIAYAASPAGELYQSADRGSTWQFAGDGPNRRPIQILGIDPHDPRRLYIAARGRRYARSRRRSFPARQGLDRPRGLRRSGEGIDRARVPQR